MHDARVDDELADAPRSGVVIATSRELHATDDAPSESPRGSESTARATLGDDHRAIAMRVVERWRALCVPDLVGPLFTRSRIELVVARLADGFLEADLVRLLEHAARSQWHLQKPSRRSVDWLFGSADRVAAVLADAPPPRRNRAAPGRSPQRQGGGGIPPTADRSTGRPNSAAPTSSREQTVTAEAAQADLRRLGLST